MSDKLVIKNGCANLIHPWVVDSDQLENAKFCNKLNDSCNGG